MKTDRVNCVQMPIRCKLAHCSILLLLFAMLSSQGAQCGMSCCPQPQHAGCDEMANSARSALYHGDMGAMAHSPLAVMSRQHHACLLGELHESCTCDRVSAALVASPAEATSVAHAPHLQGRSAGPLPDRRSVAERRRSALDRLLSVRAASSAGLTSLRI
jgi:hypothetical protein